MAGTYSEAGKNVMLDALGVLTTYVGLLNEADVEITTGTGNYARQPVDWDPADGGEKEADVVGTPVVILVPGSTTVKKIIYCSAQEGGNTYSTDDLSANEPSDVEVFTNEGTYTITSATLKIEDPV